MIDTEKNIIEKLRDRQPFLVPESYFEDFTDDLMRRLPKKIAPESKVISIYDRIKPWLYMAAIFVGIIILINVYNKTSTISEDRYNNVLSAVRVDVEDSDDADFLEIFEEMYVDKYTLAYIIDNFLID